MKTGSLSLMTEKRRAPRMPVDWRAEARVLGADEPLGAIRLENISKYGLAVHLTHSVERESVLKVSFAPSDGGSEVHAYASVAWAIPGNGEAGLRFIGIGEGDEERIAQLVEQWMLSGRGSRN